MQLNTTGMIAGIYNYCDRWCEKCTLSARCSLYTRQEPKPATGETPVNNEVAMQQLSDTLKETLAKLMEQAAAMGIDLNSYQENGDTTSNDSAAMDNIAEMENGETDAHPLLQLAAAYPEKTDLFLDEDKWLKEKYDSIDEMVAVGVLSEDEAQKTIENINEEFEVLQWYQHQIYIKLKRAAGQLYDEQFGDIDDANGSAKVALIGIDKSMAAWLNLMEHMPATEDDVLPVLSLLQKIKTLTEETFPQARKFKRPGFDD